MDYSSLASLRHAGNVPERVLPGYAVLRASPKSPQPGHRQCVPQPSSVVLLPQREFQSTQAGSVISKIESIFESIMGDLANGAGSLSIPYRSRTATARSRPQSDNNERTNAGAHLDGAVTFPGRTPHEANKFASLLRILEMSREAIVTGAVITKRNIYYQNTGLFKHQRVVDSLVDDLALTLGVGRDDLNIVAAAKGLIAGPVTLIMRNNSVIPCGLSHESGTLIPAPKLIHQIDFGLTEWILVIEKEATFRTLAAAGYHTKSLAGHGIMLTGKGFPDLATRSFLNIIHSVRPHLPMYALVDYDPDGLSIFRTYQVGSSSLLHEEDTTAPQLRWLGIRSDQILPSTQSPEYSGSPQSSQETASSSQGSIMFSAAGTSIAGHNGEEPSQSGQRRRSTHSRNGRWEALSQLTPRDRRMAVNMLQGTFQERGHGDVDKTEQMRELQMMLMLNVKAEMQTVDNLGDITHWLDERLCG